MNCSRFAAAGFAAVALGIALPAAASAEDYCVAPNDGCGANNVQKLQDALDLAASTPVADRVLLGQGTYKPEPGKSLFDYTQKGAPVEIVGAGRGKTVLTAPNGSKDEVLMLGAGPESSVHDLTIRIPAQVLPEFRGLFTNGVARRVEVIEDGDQSARRVGVLIGENGRLEDSTVTLSTEAETIGILVANPATGMMATARDVMVAARTGVRSYGFLTLDRARVTGGEVGVLVVACDTIITNSLVRQTWTYGTGIRVEPSLNYSSSLVGDGLTIVGANTLDVGGVVATTGPKPTRDAKVKLTNSVIRGVYDPLAAIATDVGEARIAASFSDYDGNENVALGTAAHIDETHVTNLGDAGFVDPAHGDFRLSSGSRLVDLGDPDVPQGLDVDRNPLVADGNGDGFARRDLGAFELQPATKPVPPAADTQAPAITGFRARAARLRYTLSEKARVTVRVQRRLAGRRARWRTLGKLSAGAKQGANRTPVTRRIRRKELRPGRYRALIVAVDGAGNRSARKIASYRVTR